MWLSILVFCAMLVLINCDGNCSNLKTDYVRVKRAKYYSSPPQRFYRRPPITYPVKGIFSYTPPPNYMMEDDHLPPKPKVSRPEGLGEEDINNILKYMSKKDLDKLIETANEKLGYKHKDEFREFVNNKRPDDEYQAKEVYNELNTFINNNKDIVSYVNDLTQSKIESYPSQVYHQSAQNLYQNVQSNPNINYPDSSQVKVIYTNAPDLPYLVRPNQLDIYQYQSNVPMNNYKRDVQPKIMNTNLEAQNMDNRVINKIPQDSFTNPIQTGINIDEMKQYFNFVENYNASSFKDNVYTDSSTMPEEELPKPLNLRDDYVVSYTNNVPTAVKADGYKVENFGELPLMNYHNSKLHSGSSYTVPHYTVTATKSKPPSPNSAPVKSPPIEYAPPGATGRDQSDAHLKAIKIWTHRSKGTAYTLHDDGTLTLEKPIPHKTYGPH